MTFSLLFVDDHPLYREGLRRALLDAMPELRVIDVADGAGAVASLSANADIDLCLVDFRLADEDGLSLLSAIGKQFPAVARGVLCSAPTGEVAARAKDAGCLACLSKDRSASSLVEALGALRDGHAVFDVPPTPTTWAVARSRATQKPKPRSAQCASATSKAAEACSSEPAIAWGACS